MGAAEGELEELVDLVRSCITVSSLRDKFAKKLSSHNVYQEEVSASFQRELVRSAHLGPFQVPPGILAHWTVRAVRLDTRVRKLSAEEKAQEADDDEHFYGQGQGQG